MGAELFVVGSEPLIFTTPDFDGNYVMENILVGRTKVECS